MCRPARFSVLSDSPSSVQRRSFQSGFTVTGKRDRGRSVWFTTSYEPFTTSRCRAASRSSAMSTAASSGVGASFQVAMFLAQ